MFRASGFCSARRLENCITDVGQWMSANRLKLNTEKKELLWAGSRHGQSFVTDCRPSLQLGADTVIRRKTTSVCSEWQSRRTWVCSVMCPTCPQHPFTGCVSSGVSDDHLILSQRPHLFTHSWPPALTSAMLYLPGPRSLLLTLCSVLWTRQHVSSVTQESSTMAWLKSCMMTYTGSMWQIEWLTNSVSSCTDVGMARLRSTSWTVAHRSLMLSAGSVSGQPHSNWWWSPDIG